MISPYYPQASQVERFDKNLKVALTIYHSNQQVNWDENLRSLLIAINTGWYKSTDATPSSVFLGTELDTPLSIKWQLSDAEL